MAQETPPLEPEFAMIQAHYDLSDDFFSLFLDPSMTYSCAKFDGPDTTLADAQIAKMELSLGKCELKPGHRLLDVGCGAGLFAEPLARLGANVVGVDPAPRPAQAGTVRELGSCPLEHVRGLGMERQRLLKRLIERIVGGQEPGAARRARG